MIVAATTRTQPHHSMGVVTPVHRFLRNEDKAAPEGLHDIVPKLWVHAARPLCCAHCRQIVTDDHARIEVRGMHDHHCENPQGLRFHIGCFANAPGCATSGEETDLYTWFEGYTWVIAACGACQTHLGWRFSAAGGGERFFGLILDRLVQAPDASKSH